MELETERDIAVKREGGEKKELTMRDKEKEKEKETEADSEGQLEKDRQGEMRKRGR